MAHGNRLMLDHIVRMWLATYKGKKFYLYTGGGNVIGLGRLLCTF